MCATAILVNGHPTDSITSRDRGLCYGDGLFETLAVVDGHPQDWEAHVERLRLGCDRLVLPPPDPATLCREALDVCAGEVRAILKIIITRGAGGRGYRIPARCTTTRILQQSPWPDYPVGLFETGIEARICTTRLARNPALAGIKHLNRLEQVLARSEWEDEYREGLMLDTQDLAVAGTASNLFVVQGDTLRTPELSLAGVAGITRQRILRAAAALGIPVVIDDIPLSALQDADGLFFSNSVIGIWPVHALAGQRYHRPALVDRLATQLESTR